MRAGFSAEGQFTKLSTRQLWLVVSKFFASEKSAGEVKQRECSSCLPGRLRTRPSARSCEEDIISVCVREPGSFGTR
jgi:hypothetical protein